MASCAAAHPLLTPVSNHHSRDSFYGGEPIVEFYLPSGYFVSCYYISTLLGHTGGALGLDGGNSSYVIDDSDLYDIMNDIRLTIET